MSSNDHNPIESIDNLLTVDEVLARLKDRSPSHYLDLYNVMKGVTLAAGGLALLEITLQHWSTGRLAIWVLALAGAILTYYGATAGSALLNARPGFGDIAFPMALSLSELMLIYRPGTAVDSHAEWMPTDWFALLGAWCLLCSLVILTVSRAIELSKYTLTLEEQVKRPYLDRLKKDRLASFFCGVATLALFTAWELQILPTEHIYKAAVVLIVFVVIAYALYNQGETSRRIEDSVLAASTAEASPATCLGRDVL
jgi:hypothetical protein